MFLRYAFPYFYVVWFLCKASPKNSVISFVLYHTCTRVFFYTGAFVYLFRGRSIHLYHKNKTLELIRFGHPCVSFVSFTHGFGISDFWIFGFSDFRIFGFSNFRNFGTSEFTSSCVSLCLCFQF